jgi:hypothetical protein
MWPQRVRKGAAPWPAALVGSTIAALLTTACGSTDAELRRTLAAERGTAIEVVSRAQVESQPPGSPGRAVMDLWRAVQFDDAKTAVSLIAPRPAAAELPRTEELVIAVGGAVTDSAKPRILEVDRTAGGARVSLEVVSTDDREQEPARRTELKLVRTGSGWRVLAEQALGELLQEALG